MEKYLGNEFVFYYFEVSKRNIGNGCCYFWDINEFFNMYVRDLNFYDY